jgi:hypothetical protein
MTDKKWVIWGVNTAIFKNSYVSLWVGIVFCLSYTGLIYMLKPLLPVINFLPDTGYAHYYWKLPNPTYWSQATAWIGYFSHQAAVWLIIYAAQSSNLKYSKGLNKFNILAMGVNAFFVFFHLLQTHIWYDGLAQDTHIMTSQGSVIIMLVMILIMENQRRGLAFGKMVNYLSEPGRVLRKYHGYVFAWAVIYTFWYHPMEASVGHLIGTFYTCMIMLQGSLIYTRAHLNKYWTFLIEFLVVVHGTLVALMQDNGMWAMFLFGFLTLFVVTQMHGLGISKTLRWFFVVLYGCAVLFVYNILGWHRLSEVPRIPFVEYGLVFCISFFIWVGLWLLSRWGRMSNKT